MKKKTVQLGLRIWFQIKGGKIARRDERGRGRGGRGRRGEGEEG